MNILHLTDLHFTNSGTKSVSKLQDLSSSLVKYLSSESIDFIFFTGDLVYSGSNKSWFNMAHDILLKPLLENNLAQPENLFFCQGNHDVDRNSIRAPFIKYLDEEIKDNQKLNDFVNENSPDFIDTLEPSKNYYNFISGLKRNDSDFYNEMYTTHMRTIRTKKIGIVSINTSWRSNGDDVNKLLYPTKLLEAAIKMVESADVKILLHHHPINELKELNNYLLEDIIHNKFDISFFGHRHKGKTSIDYTPNTGLIKILSPATLKRESDSDIGFSIVKFDFQEHQFEVSKHLYNTKDNFFYKHPEVYDYEMPQSNETKELNTFRRKIREFTKTEKEKAKDLIVASKDQKNDFLSLFVEPIIRKQKDGSSFRTPLKIDQILFDNIDYLIPGDDKVGKTSLLKKCLLTILDNFEYNDSYPIYIDLKQEKDSFSISDIENKIKSTLTINRKKARKLLKDKKVILLIDNFNIQDEWQAESLEQIISEHNQFKLIITAIQSTEVNFEPPKIKDRDLILLKFDNLRKREIRELTKKWKFDDLAKREEIVSKIDSIFKQLSIPFNFWTISLFLYVFKKSGVKSIQNNVGLVNLYIESLLERENLIRTNASFAYEKYLNLLAYIAYYLFSKHSTSVYSASEMDILKFIDEYLKKNPRNKNIEALKVWNYLKERSIFKQIENGYYSFRLNGVFEFFIAFYMKIDSSLVDEILKDDSSYLEFKNEFEIYAGFDRSNEAFLDKIFKKSKAVFKDINSDYENTSLDHLLKSKLGYLPNYESKINELSSKAKALSIDEQDEIENIADELGIESEIIEGVRKKEPIDLRRDNIYEYENALFILGRVFRTIDDINDSKKVYEIFNYYIKTLCHWGFEVIERSKSKDFETNYNETETTEVDLLYELMSKFVPFIIQEMATYQINQKNLEGIIQNKVDEIKSKKIESENQYELFILFFMLIDLKISTNRKLITDISDLITIPSLKSSILLKLNKYLMFNTNEDRDLEQFLKNAIQKENLKINSKTDIGGLHKNFSDQKKQRLLKRN